MDKRLAKMIQDSGEEAKELSAQTRALVASIDEQCASMKEISIDTSEVEESSKKAKELSAQTRALVASIDEQCANMKKINIRVVSKVARI